jgi:hypothetical protein
MPEVEWQEHMDGAIEGFTHFWSETGTEGGYWAVQDREFIGKTMPKFGVWEGDVVYDGRNSDREGKVVASEMLDGRPLPAPDGSYGVSEGQVVRARVWWPDNRHEETRPSDSLLKKTWDYTGLKVLKNNDRIVIYEPDGVTVKWAGVIQLMEVPLFTEDAFGMWIHSDQIGEPRESWSRMFIREHPCRLWLS